MNPTTQEYRKRIADAFVQALEEKQLRWHSGLRPDSWPVNAYTGKSYKGINKLGLFLSGLSGLKEGETPDNRWATFKQIQNKGWRLKKGASGVKVEYWQPYDFKLKQPLSWEEFNIRAKEDGVKLLFKYYTVFNGKDIIGIPPLEHPSSRMVVADELIEKISSGMQVKILNDGGRESYYNVVRDEIHLPLKEIFENSYEYNATALHELSHATAAENRLNRDIKNKFGTKAYAYEELVAEISACFMGEHLELAETELHMENHKAYVQSWIQCIKEDPNVLTHAVKDAEDAANYLEYQAGILSRDKYLDTMLDKREIPENKIAAENNDIRKELQENGYKPTAAIMKKIEELNNITGRSHSLSEIQETFCNRTYRDNPSADKLLGEIGKGLQNQELLCMQLPHP